MDHKITIEIIVRLDGLQANTQTVVLDQPATPAPVTTPLPAPADLVERFLDHVAEQGKSPATATAYRHCLAAFTAWLSSTGLPFDLAAITPRNVADWRTYQQTTENAAPSTINLRLTAVSQLYGWAINEGLATINPTTKIKHLEKARLQPKGLTDDEVDRLLGAARTDGDLRNVALVELMVGSGLRVAEVLALKRNDIELGEKSGRVIVRKGKGSKYRQVPLPAAACRAIEAYLVTENIGPKDLLWIGQRGPLVTARAIDKVLKVLAETAGIAHLSPHTLRHTFAHRYLAANPGDLRGLASLMGHASLNTTMIYTEPSQADLAERVERAAGSR